MQSNSRAPVLSATRTRVSCWIIGLLRHLEDLGQPPALRLRKRARLDDADDVARLRGVLLVVGVELRRAPDHLLVARVHLQRVHADDDRLLHRARDDDAAPPSPGAASGSEAGSASASATASTGCSSTGASAAFLRVRFGFSGAGSSAEASASTGVCASVSSSVFFFFRSATYRLSRLASRS